MNSLFSNFTRGERQAAPSRPAAPSRDGATYPEREGLQ
jgi:hypothetical protein